MNELIAIGKQEVGQGTVQTVNARDLHAFLEVGKDFSNWIKDRIKKYEFQDEVDFTMVFRSPELANQTGRGGDRRSIEYHLTLDMAKELSMVERNAKGKEARQYFLECERRAMVAAPVDPIQLLNDPESLRQVLLTYSEKVITLESKVAEQEPKVQALDRLCNADGLENITNVAKALQIKPSVLFAWLKANRWIYRRVGGKGNVAYQDRIQQGLLTHKITTVQCNDGTERIIENVMVTAKGMAKLSQVFAQEQMAA